ncbi:MAG: hypothetical protein ABL949_03730 [Fimbriimonadaceae bacterium]
MVKLRWIVFVAIAICGCAQPRLSPKFSVALILTDATPNKMWDQGGYEGLAMVKQQLGCDVLTVACRTSEERQKTTQELLDNGYKLVLHFGASEAGSTSGKVIAVGADRGVRLVSDEAFYLAGLAAKSVSKSGRIGFVSRNPTGANVLAVKKAVGAANVLVMAPESEFDVASSAAVQRAIAGGADVILQDLLTGYQGVFESCEGNGILAMGYFANQNEDSPAILGSVVVTPGRAFLDIATNVKEGKPGGRAEYRFKDGVSSFVINPDQRYRVPDPVLARLVELEKGFMAGKPY